MDPHEAHAEAIRSNNRLLNGTYEDGFKAGREAGMREAAALLRRSEDRLIGGIRRVAAADRHTAYVLHNHADAILSAIEGAK